MTLHNSRSTIICLLSLIAAIVLALVLLASFRAANAQKEGQALSKPVNPAFLQESDFDPSVAIQGSLPQALNQLSNSTTNAQAISTSQMELVTFGQSGQLGNGGDHVASISKNGRFVVFNSAADDLLINIADNNDANDVFLFDRETGTVELISKSRDGAKTGNGNSGNTIRAITDDGQYVVFTSEADDLVANDENNAWDIFLWNREHKTIQIVCLNANNQQPTTDCQNATISGDGRFIAFNSRATNLHEDANGALQVYLRNLQTQEINLISTDVTSNSLNPLISGDGNHVIFDSQNPPAVSIFNRENEENGVQGSLETIPNTDRDGYIAENGDYVVYTNNGRLGRRRPDGTTQGLIFNDLPIFGTNPRISEDGNIIVFASDQTDLVPNDTNGVKDIFAFNMAEDKMQRISVDTNAQQLDVATSGSVMSIDGRYILLRSIANNVVPGDTNNQNDWFFLDRLFTATPTHDFVVTDIEITQAIQDLQNSVPLVANKRTYARVYAMNIGTPSNALVTSELCHQLRNECIPPLNPGQRIRITESTEQDVKEDREDIHKSFYFELPETWLTGDLQLDATVNPIGDNHISENVSSNNTKILEHITFQNIPPIQLKLIRVGTYVQAVGFPAVVAFADDVHLDQVESWLGRAYPISSLDSYRTTIPVLYAWNWLYGVTKQLSLHFEISQIRELALLLGEDPLTVYYGIFDDGLFDFSRFRGMGKNLVAVGPAGEPGADLIDPSFASWDTDGSFADWYAGHEIFHALSSDPYSLHVQGCPVNGADCFTPAQGEIKSVFCKKASGDNNYPYLYGAIGGGNTITETNRFIGFDIETRVVYPAWWRDVMTYCDYQWISDYNYKRIMNLIPNPSTLATRQNSIASNYFLVKGFVNLTQNVGTMDAIWQIPSTNTFSASTNGNLSIKLFDNNNTLLGEHYFEATTDDETNQNGDEIGGFVEIVPWAASVYKIAVYLDNNELDSRIISPNTPQLSLNSPNGGEVLSEPAMVTWDATDADNDDLTYSVLFSPDNGVTWEPITGNITHTTSITLELSALPGTEEGKIRVMVSDGINTSTDESDGTFQIAHKPPYAQIISPFESELVTPDQILSLIATGRDLEDEQLADTAFSWNSNLAGFLGTGKRLDVANLGVGEHTITLTVTDSDGQTATDTVVVMIKVPPQDVSVGIRKIGLVNESYEFTANASPISATAPFTYVWEVTGHLPITLTNGLSDAQSFSWDTPGTKVITTSVTNGMIDITDVHTITIGMAPPATSISSNNPDVVLTWQHLGDYVDHYEIWRSPTPYFAVGDASATKLAEVNGTTSGNPIDYEDEDALSININYFYIVRAISGSSFVDSKRSGKFDFTIQAGSS